MSVPKALELADAFAARTTPGKFTKLNRATVANGLRERIGNPFLIQQSQTGTCVTAAMLYGIARDQPLLYAEAVISLFETGACKIRNWSIRPDAELQDMPCPANQNPPFHETDWIILASVRDSENWWFDFHSERDHFAGSGSVYETEKWMKKAGFTDVQSDDGGILYSTLNDKDRMLRKALELFNNNYHVVLAIHHSIIDAQLKPYPKWSGTDHVVAIAARFEIPENRDSKISVPIFTWGTKMDIPRVGSLTCRQFLEHFGHYVAGKA